MNKSKIILIVIIIIAVILGLVVGCQNKEPIKKEPAVQSNEKNTNVEQTENKNQPVADEKQEDIKQEETTEANPNNNTQSTKPSNKMPTTSTAVDQSKPIVIEKKIIDATKKYSCKSSWNYDSTTHNCSFYNETTEYIEIQCPTDYEYSEGVCNLVNKKATINPTKVKTCTTGDEYLQEIDGVYSCSTGSITNKDTCPEGYILKNMSNDSLIRNKCIEGREATVEAKTVCTNDYTLNSLGVCYIDLEEPATITYNCPTGYTLKEDKCYEN